MAPHTLVVMVIRGLALQSVVFNDLMKRSYLLHFSLKDVFGESIVVVGEFYELHGV